MMLTYEVNSKDKSVEIIFDFQGLEYFKKLISNIDLKSSDGADHVH